MHLPGLSYSHYFLPSIAPLYLLWGGERLYRCSINVSCFVYSTVVVILRGPGLGEAQEMMWSCYIENKIALLASVRM
jgi:hypothetical protein